MMVKSDFVLWGIVFLCIGALIIIFSLCIPLDREIAELGQAICKERYGMDFDKYHGKILYCKPDGIKIEIDHTD